MGQYGSESEEQIALFQWAAYMRGKYPELENLLFHIPNGGKRARTTAVRLKAEGVKPGVPDVELAAPRGIYHGLFIEMKYGRNKTTDYQNTLIAELRKQGYKVCVCYSCEEAENIIMQYLNLPCVNILLLLRQCFSENTIKGLTIAE